MRLSISVSPGSEVSSGNLLIVSSSGVKDYCFIGGGMHASSSSSSSLSAPNRLTLGFNSIVATFTNESPSSPSESSSNNCYFTAACFFTIVTTCSPPSSSSSLKIPIDLMALVTLSPGFLNSNLRWVVGRWYKSSPFTSA